LSYYLAADFQHKNIGTIVGQETAGNQKGLNGGQILFLRLPNSDIEIDFPIMGIFATEEKPDRGIVPAHIVQPTVDDVANDRDAALIMAKALINNANNN
jgi:hypothetical protein